MLFDYKNDWVRAEICLGITSREWNQRTPSEHQNRQVVWWSCKLLVLTFYCVTYHHSEQWSDLQDQIIIFTVAAADMMAETDR